eukprot:4988166-Amphidinium_carterae.1
MKIQVTCCSHCVTCTTAVLNCGCGFLGLGPSRLLGPHYSPLWRGLAGHSFVDTAAWSTCVLPSFARYHHAAFLASAGAVGSRKNGLQFKYLRLGAVPLCLQWFHLASAIARQSSCDTSDSAVEST